MKNIFKFIVVLVFTFFLNTLCVKAATNDSILTTSYIDNVWSFHYRNGKVFTYGQLPFRYLNGKMAYCIDPPTPINTNIYSSYNDFSVSGYSDDIKKQMELIAHYGYEYPGHNTIKYYMATQELIWLFSDDEYIKWTVSDTSSSEEINIENEKNDILQLVNKHNILPSFINACYVQDFGTKLKLADSNNVLSNYDIITDLQYTTNNSIIEFNANKFGNHTINLKSKNKKDQDSIVYKSDDTRSQMMSIFGFRDIKEGSFSIVISDISVRINKVDKETNELISDSQTEFRIKNVDTGKYVKEGLKTNKSGYVIVKLKKGKYEIEEVKAPDGYLIDDEKIIIEIDDNVKLTGPYYDVNIFNEEPKGKINITKVCDDGSNLGGVEIGIYDRDYKFLGSVVTDENGKASIDNLSLGTYYVKELSAPNGYVIDTDYRKVKLQYKDDKTKIVEANIKITNKKIKCDITYISSDNRGKRIEGIKINLYNESDEMIFSGKTGKNGMIVIKDLPYGNYYIKQVSVPNGYILNNDVVDFSVNDLSCIADIKVNNEKTKMPITSSSKQGITGLFLMMIFGVMFFVKKII